MKTAIALALVTISCRPPVPKSAIDPRLAARVPGDATALAGLDLAALRASPLYAKLPHPFGEARYVLIAVRGAEVTTIVLGADGAVAGGAEAARGGRSPLLAEAEPLAAGNSMWAVIRGGTALPLAGNLANLNNLLADAGTVTLGARLGDRMTAELVAACPTLEAARRFEGSLRAVLLLSKAAQVTRVEREGWKVKATLTGAEEFLGALLR